MCTHEMLLVGTLTTVLNDEGYIEVYIKSILKQGYRNVVHVFVGSGSTDHSQVIHL